MTVNEKKSILGTQERLLKLEQEVEVLKKDNAAIISKYEYLLGECFKLANIHKSRNGHAVALNDRLDNIEKKLDHINHAVFVRVEQAERRVVELEEKAEKLENALCKITDVQAEEITDLEHKGGIR